MAAFSTTPGNLVRCFGVKENGVRRATASERCFSADANLPRDSLMPRRSIREIAMVERT